MCADIARTDVVAATWSTEEPARVFDGNLFIERLNINENASSRAKVIASLCGPLAALPSTKRFQDREGRRTRRISMKQRADDIAGAIGRATSNAAWLNLIVDSLRNRGLAESLPPRVVVCHDVYALVAAVAMKRKFGCPVVYDSHEYWPEADLLAPKWEQRLTRAFERRFIRRADVVVTVTPQLARLLEKVYGLQHVLSVPNAEPMTDIPFTARDAGRQITFLLQGRAAPGRGIEELLEAWRRVEVRNVVLALRCPENQYLSNLMNQFADLFDARRVVCEPAVAEDLLVRAASTADVGLIPYGGSSLNHVYACPNKLSQYMAAGLAVLSNRLPFVEGILDRFDAGITYDASDPSSLSRAVARLAEHPDQLDRMRSNAYAAARASFNWDVVSEPYRAAVTRLYEGRE